MNIKTIERILFPSTIGYTCALAATRYNEIVFTVGTIWLVTWIVIWIVIKLKKCN